MPFDSNESLPKGVKGLPPEQQSKWRKVFNAAYEGSCKDKGDKRDECASKIAWSQIGSKYKGNALTEFSMALKSATHDKQKGTYRWKAVASDTDEDYYEDNMSMELFDDFINRIEIKELAPEEFRTTFWQGGMPYISVSHYPDLEGAAVPGSIDTVFVDGNQLRSYGQFDHTPLGLACYDSVCKDLYQEPKPENPVRVSIAFLDFGHVHKSNEYEFERESLDDICPECIKESITGKTSGKIFKKGQLVHLALTRVPANERTSMEVEKSMTTRKEDAESIIGEELAEEIDKKAKLVGKSQALVIKSEEEVEEVSTEEVLEEVPAVEPVVELVEEAKKPMKDEKEEDAEEDDEDMKKKEHMKSSVDERLDKIEKMISDLASIQPVPAVLDAIPSHELDTVFSQFKSAYDEIKALPTTADDKLHQLQEHFVSLADVVRDNINTVDQPQAEEPTIEGNDLVQALSLAITGAMKPVSDKLDLLLTQNRETVVKSATDYAIPVRRSIPPNLSMQKDISPLKSAVIAKTSETPKLQAITRKSVGLQ